MKTLLLFGAIALSVNAFGQNVNIPDANFKAYLVGELAINTNDDAEIQVTEATAFGGAIDCASLDIFDLTGIEEFTALTTLVCKDNQLTSLDVTQNTYLTYLGCELNQLTSLDVSQNTSLTSLKCWNNQLTSLDITQNTALTTLVCKDNQLTALDVTQNTALTNLYCFNNQLTTLDITQNTALTNLHCSENELMLLDVTQNTSLTYLECWDNPLTSLDVSQNTALTYLWCFGCQLTCLNVKNGNNSNFTHFDTKFNSNLTCIEVDNVAYSNANWTNIDAQASFSIDCNNACSSIVGIEELVEAPKELIKITDLMGRETEYKPNTVLIYVYSDGTTEKIFKVEL